MSFQLVPKSVTLNGVTAVILFVISPNSAAFSAKTLAPEAIGESDRSLALNRKDCRHRI